MTQLSLKLKSRRVGTSVPVMVLLPEPGRNEDLKTYYASDERRKVLWLLHGGGCDWETLMTEDTLLDVFRNRRLMVVIPSAYTSDFANHMQFATGFAFMDFFFEELMPFVQHSLRGSERREDNYIGGYSMGGAGALLLGFRHPERFAGIGALGSSMRESDFLQPYLDMTGPEFRAFAEEDRTRLPTEFGNPALGITLKEINMIARYPTVRDYVDGEECTWNRYPEVLASGMLPKLFFSCGDRDGCYPGVQRFRAYAEKLGPADITYDVIPGRGHDCEEACIRRMLEHFGL